jgi:hypothetical protein
LEKLGAHEGCRNESQNIHAFLWLFVELRLIFQELKDEYFANINAEKPKIAEKADGAKHATSSKQKKPVAKKKAAEHDPFASDDDENAKQPVKNQKINAGAKRSMTSDAEDDERPTKKKS